MMIKSMLGNLVKHMLQFLVIMLLSISTAQSGVYSDALGQCLIDSTSNKDRNKLIVWFFSAASQHPVVKGVLTVNAAELSKANKEFADLTMKLLTEDCRVEAKKAVKIEGLTSLQSSFKVFGEAAGRELFASPYVAKALASYVTYLDLVTLGLMLSLE